ncbi:pyrroline-5-carboxylate reductase 1, mitochondrial [Athalia rosae]|uniref:pyrroline-5-carboxylate reductase 1, mitochondrial n=1 Tax=Athalia rosae TaxID=37344 RepID=UPI002034448E|nr:pyrroline-5-carboxylate reductase 1, mitochondrial [Athalia rosae]
MLKIGFCGGGMMAQALAKAFMRAGLTRGELMVASCLPNDSGSIKAFEEMGSRTVFNNEEITEHNGDIVILAVKPQAASSVLSDLRKASSPIKLMLSIAMGISISTIEKALPSETPVIRAMPNTPSVVGFGATVFARGKNADQKDADIASRLFKSVGICEEVGENMIDPVTALASSGPAYVFVMIEALADGAVKMGMPRNLAYKLATQTILGAGAMAKETQRHPGQLKDEVASPAGSTIAALHYLERYGFRSALIGAVEAATLRCREVGREK